MPEKYIFFDSSWESINPALYYVYFDRRANGLSDHKLLMVSDNCFRKTVKQQKAISSLTHTLKVISRGEKFKSMMGRTSRISTSIISLEIIPLRKICIISAKCSI